MKARPLYLLIPAIAVLIAGLSIMAAKKSAHSAPVLAPSSRPTSGSSLADASGFALVELFTSEGCSSCPAAEATLAKLALDFPSNVYVLELHVDYWDRLGWKDIYSSGEYTRMQQDYAKTFRLSSIYTPQAVINGETECVGSDEGRLRAAIQSGLQRSKGSFIDLHVTATGARIQVSYRVPEASKEKLYVALVQNHAETQVGAGENSGRLLKHFHIVREIRSADVDAGVGGNLNFEWPRGLEAGNAKIIAWLQGSRITGATGSSIGPSSP